MSVADDFELLLPRVTKASRYLGTETNAVQKNRADVDLLFCLAFPDAYEVGMSHLGLHILYHILNNNPAIACERAFAPWPDLEAEMQRRDIPLLTLESRTPLRQCDILGFSLEYELSYATVLRMLGLARIPLRARDRDGTMPLLIAGGPCTYNPEPVADFFDAFVIGDGEEVLLEICRTFLSWRQKHGSKPELLEALAAIPGVYVPSLFNVARNDDGTIRQIIPLVQGYEKIEKRVATGFDHIPFCTAPAVPYLQTIHDRAGVEIARGCTRGCRFCMAGIIYRPVREKSVAAIRTLSDRLLAATGYEELSLVSLSSGDHSCIHDLVRMLMADHRHDRVAVSFPSLRVATLTRDMIEEIKRVRKTGFTIAPEAGSRRLRMVINKGIEDDEILATASRVFNAGWNLLKLYFMIGLPTETGEDLDAIVSLCRTIAGRHPGKQLNVSVSTFVPKPHTPFQWEGQQDTEAVREKQTMLKSRLHRGSVQVKYHDRQVSMLEGVFSRGDRNLGRVLLEAHRLGAGFEAWSEYFKIDLWRQAFKNCGIDPCFYLRERRLDETLPWSHISCGITESFLRQEREKAFRGEPTPDCRQGVCTGCGVCTALSVTPELVRNTPGTADGQKPGRPGTPPAPAVRFRLSYTKTGSARFLSHLELARTLARAMRRARLPLLYSQGYHPLPRIIFYNALPVGIESLGEICDIELQEFMPASAVLAVLRPHLPAGIEITAAQEITSRKNRPVNKKHTYKIEGVLSGHGAFMNLQRCIDDFHGLRECVIEINRQDKLFHADIRRIVQRCTLINDSALELELLFSDKKNPKVTEIISRIFNFEDEAVQSLRITKLPG